MNGIQEVSGSIPLISTRTKTVVSSEMMVFFVLFGVLVVDYILAARVIRAVWGSVRGKSSGTTLLLKQIVLYKVWKRENTRQKQDL